MANIYAPHGVDRHSAQYCHVRSEAQRRPASPRIRAVWSETYGAWIAIEGSHRLAACDELGYVPEIVDMTRSQAVRHDHDDFRSPARLSPTSPFGCYLLRAPLLGAPLFLYDDADVPPGRVAIEDRGPARRR